MATVALSQQQKPGPGEAGVVLDRGMGADDESTTYGFSKQKLPTGWAYPVRRSRLNQALSDQAATPHVFTVRFILAHGKGQIVKPEHPLDVTYGGEADPTQDAGKVSITVWAVPSDERRAIQELLEESLPAVAEWIASTASQLQVWRSQQHHLMVAVDGDGARLIEGGPRLKKRRT